MPPPPDRTITAIETLLASEDDAIAAYKIAILRITAIPGIRRCGECLRAHELAARELARVRARLLAKQGQWGNPWNGRRKPTTALRIGAIEQDHEAEEHIFHVLAAAEAEHEQKLQAALTEEPLPRDVQTLLERLASDASQRRAPAANGARIAARG